MVDVSDPANPHRVRTHVTAGYAFDVYLSGSLAYIADGPGGLVILEFLGSSVVNESYVPATFFLSQNYPNPFNPVTTIPYQLPRSGNIELSICNLSGQKIRTLVKENKTAGQHQVQWNGKNDAGEAVASGVYIYQFIAGDFVQSRKLLLMR
jgi:hypothetical protein